MPAVSRNSHHLQQQQAEVTVTKQLKEQPVQDAPINLKRDSSPPPVQVCYQKQSTHHHNEETDRISASQDEPMDFSTTKEAAEPAVKEVAPQTSFTSSRELKFAKNLKILLVEILRYGRPLP